MGGGGNLADNILFEPQRIEIHVLESDAKNLTLLSRSDMVFAILCSVLFLWGAGLTLASI